MINVYPSVYEFSHNVKFEFCQHYSYADIIDCGWMAIQWDSRVAWVEEAE